MEGKYRGDRMWNNAQLIAVAVAIDQDQRDNRMEANVNVLCPNCQTESLRYDRTDSWTMQAWCKTCRAGISQGEER